MPLVSSIDYPNKKIYLGIDSVGVTLDTLDVYREVRERRRTTVADRKYRNMIVGGGNIQKTPTTYTQPYCQLLYGCEIIPYDADQTLTIVRDTFSDDGRAGAQCFGLTGFTNNVVIVEAVDKVEVREVATGGGGSSAADVWAYAIEAGYTAAEIMRILGSLSAGKSSGHPLNPVFNKLDDSGPRISGTVDAQGNRTSVTIDGT